MVPLLYCERTNHQHTRMITTDLETTIPKERMIFLHTNKRGVRGRSLILMCLFFPKTVHSSSESAPMLLQSYMEVMVKAATLDLEAWERRVAEAGGSLDFDVEADVHTISGRVLSCTAFGNDSFEKGQEIYHLQMQYAQLLFEAYQQPTNWIPGYRYVRHNHIYSMPPNYISFT
jgi:hypothetical protein